MALTFAMAGVSACSFNKGEFGGESTNRSSGEPPPGPAESGTIVGLAGKCLAVTGTGSGSKAHLQDCSAARTQAWIINQGHIINAAGKCLDVDGIDGLTVRLEDCAGSANETWSVEGNLIKGVGGKCLDVNQGQSANGTPVQLAVCAGGINQSWKFQKDVAASPKAAEGIGPPGSGWTATFADEFDGDTIDRSKWNTTWINGGRTVSWSLEIMLDANVTVADGSLHILQFMNQDVHTIVDGKEYDPQDQSGTITTYGPGKVHQTYGYFEARIKTAPGMGELSAFWMSNEDHWPPELDIIEVLGRDVIEHGESIAHLTQHYDADNKTDATQFKSGTDFSKDYHVFGCNWQPDQITWYVDGVVRKTAPNRLNEIMYLELNIHSRNPWAGYPALNDGTNHYMDVDYVRAWKK